MSIRRFPIWCLLTLSLSALALAGCDHGGVLGPVANAKAADSIRGVLQKNEKSSGGDAAAATGTGWATLRGRFEFDGPPPQMQPYDVSKDQSICSEGGKNPLQETLLVDDKTHGIKNIVVFLRNASRVNPSATLATDPAVFDQKACKFLSHVLPVGVGQKVQLTNSDPVGHNTKFGNFNQIIESHKFVEFTPQKEEPLPLSVSCSIHPWMQAYLLPRANQYVAVTDANGAFKITNVPAGEPLEFQVWHESATGGGLVPGTPETRTLNWTNKGRFKITLQADEEKELPLIKVPASAFKL